MKKIKLIILTALLISGISLSFVAVRAASTNASASNPTLAKYSGKDETQIKNDLKKLSKQQLFVEFDNVAKECKDIPSDENLIPFASELIERKNDFDDSEIIGNIKNNAYSSTSRQFMVEFYNDKKGNNPNVSDNSLKDLLKDDTINNDIKVKIVVTSKFENSDKGLLKDFVEKNDDVLAFHSLKKLGQVDSSEAYIISKDILSNYKSKSNFKVSAAQKFMAQYFKKNNSNDQDLINNFIKVNSDIINTSKDNVLKDSSVFSLSDMMSKDGITEIINNKSIDRELKVFSIDQNCLTLREMLSSNPTEKDIEVVVKAMEISPLKDLLSDIEKAKMHLNNVDLQKRCNNVLKSIELNGTYANKKWIENK